MINKVKEVKLQCFYLRIKSLFFNIYDVMKTVGGVKIP